MKCPKSEAPMPPYGRRSQIARLSMSEACAQRSLYSSRYFYYYKIPPLFKMANFGSIIAGINTNFLHSNMRAADTTGSLPGLDLDYALGTASGELSSMNSSEPGSPNTPFARGGALSWPEDSAVSDISSVITLLHQEALPRRSSLSQVSRWG